ncbi:SprT family protein [Streptococcus macedonicus]|uniref:SprT family protein n=1 Tax=Streptococcus macedonicus TaxID=59310 RepID=UPI000811D705|nr:SprT family protein [Streptococcus macedonicus]SCA90173.1 Putative metallopeptidase (Zinc) SprT family [Streptococcus macedonicus]
MNLTNFIKTVSREDFGKEFRHKAVWNPRLRTTGGRFFPADGHLDFNPKIYEAFVVDVFRKIVRHELCHYHLYFEGKGYKHADADFKALLKAVDGLRYAPAMPQKTEKYLYRCQKCGRDYHRKRRVNTQKYRCGRCHGKLLEIKNQEI